MIIHVVRLGDTIYSIAEMYGVSPDKVILDNELTNPDNLVIGQTLVILDPKYDQQKLRSMEVNGYTYPNIDRAVLEKTLPYLTYLTIFTYGFTEEGELIGVDDEALIQLAREKGVAPLMLISTLAPDGKFSNELASTILNDITLQNKLIDQILKNMIEKNYYGLDIDFEYIYPEDKEAYVAFINNITKKLNERNYPTFVALAPKTSTDQPGLLYEAHDYRGIGQAANSVLLMTYEWGYTYGPPMAVAPLNKVQEVLNYAVTQIPPEKILMGIPNYGYDWTLPFVPGVSQAKSLSNVAAVDLARKYGSIIQYDELSQAPFFNYYDEEGKEHVVWFEDARSIKAKLMQVENYGFQGASYWNIMKYFPQNWLVLNALYNIVKKPL